MLLFQLGPEALIKNWQWTRVQSNCSCCYCSCTLSLEKSSFARILSFCRSSSAFPSQHAGMLAACPLSSEMCLLDIYASPLRYQSQYLILICMCFWRYKMLSGWWGLLLLSFDFRCKFVSLAPSCGSGSPGRWPFASHFPICFFSHMLTSMGGIK